MLKFLKQVLIPLNRVIVIELFGERKVINVTVSFNPLKSGHCYWIYKGHLLLDPVSF